jgi:acyl carrier protein
MATIEERIKKVTARVLKLEAKDIRLEDSFAWDLGAESVQSIELVAMFEKEFGIEMEEDAALAVETVGGAVDFIRKVCQQQGVEVEG